MADEVVVGATGKDFVLDVVDEFNQPVDITGGTFTLLGNSEDLPGVTITEAGTLTDPTNGVVTWVGIGDYITTGDLAALDRATFTFRVKWEDGATLVDYTPRFQWDYAAILP
jgi:hypothetical protein